MKKWLMIPVLLLFFTGCGKTPEEMEAALAFRSRIRETERMRFTARICAAYTDRTEEFALRCETDGAGFLTFAVTEPEEISGITGGVAGEMGNLTFDDTVLAFPLLAQERLSPVCGPWVLIQALRAGQITACVLEGELLHITVDDRYGEDPLTLEVWIRGETVVEAEIAWRGLRQMTMEIEEFAIG